MYVYDTMWVYTNLSGLYVDIQEDWPTDLIDLWDNALRISMSIVFGTYFQFECLCQDDFEDLLNIDGM